MVAASPVVSASSQGSDSTTTSNPPASEITVMPSSNSAPPPAGTQPRTQRPGAILPADRGHRETDYLMGPSLVPAPPDLSAFGDLGTSLGHLRFPSIDLSQLLQPPPLPLPTLPIDSLAATVTSTLHDLLATVPAVRSALTNTAMGIAAAARTAATASRRSAALSPACSTVPAACYTLTTSAGGVGQTFQLPLCVPTPIDVNSTNLLTPTTAVDLCPVPLDGGAATNLVGNLGSGQPEALYLSVLKLTSSFPATFSAAYTVPATNVTVRFGIATTQNYPDSATIGGATDYNPLIASPSTRVVTGWTASNATVDSFSVGVDGVGDITASRAIGSGSVAVDLFEQTVTANLRSSNPAPASVQLRKLTGSTLTDTSSITWSNLPTALTCQLTSDGTATSDPNQIKFSGQQASGTQNGLSIGLLTTHNGAPSASLTQTGFGAGFETSVQLARDGNQNVNGVTVISTPQYPSAFVAEGFSNGTPRSFVEMATMPPNQSSTAVQFQGSGGGASTGLTVTTTNAPSDVAAGSYDTTAGLSVSPAIQSSVLLSLGMVPGPLPIGLGAGAQTSVQGLGLAHDYHVGLSQAADGGTSSGAMGFDLSVSTPDSVNEAASSFVLREQVDPLTQAVVLANHLSQTSRWTLHAHGAGGAPSGFDTADASNPPLAAEFKEVAVLRGGAVVAVGAITRNSSDRTGMIPFSGLQAIAMDPPYDFSMSVDYSSAPQQLAATAQGTNAAPSGGQLVLSSPDGTSLTINAAFQMATWSANLQETGASLRSPDSVEVTATGSSANPAGSVSVQAPGGLSLLVSSFTTNTHTKMDFIHAGADISGVTVEGDNASANPAFLVQLLVPALNTSVNVLGPSAGSPIEYGATVVMGNVPTLQFTAQVHRTGPTSVHIESHNPSPQPGEYVRVGLPADGTPGGRIQTVVRGMDIGTQIDETYDRTGGAIHLTVKAIDTSSGGANPNPYLAIDSAVLDSGGNAAVAMLLNAASADTSGLYASGYQQTVRWSPIPVAFDLDFQASTPASTVQQSSNLSATLKLNVPAAIPNAVFRVDDTANDAHIEVDGVGPDLSFGFTDASPAASGQGPLTLDVSGTVPAGFGAAEAWHNGTNLDDTFLLVTATGAQPQPLSHRGNEVLITPASGGAGYKHSIGYKDGTLTYSADQDTAGGGLSVQQWSQVAPGDTSTNPRRVGCQSGGTPLICRGVSMGPTPMHVHMQINLSAQQQSGTPQSLLTFSASDSNFGVTFNSLVDSPLTSAMFSGIPSGGMTMTYAVGDSGLNMHLAPNAPATETLPYFYVEGQGVSFRVVTKGSNNFSIGPAVLMASNWDIHVNYVGVLSVQGTSGLNGVDVLSHAPGGTAAGDGIFGVKVQGPPSGNVTLGLNFAVAPDVVQSTALDQHVSWNWSVLGSNMQSGNLEFGTAPDPNNFSNGLIGLYSWEATSKLGNQLAGTGCSGAEPDVNTSTFSPIPLDQFPYPPSYPVQYDGLATCGGHVAYYFLNPGDFLFEYCNDMLVLCPTGSGSDFRYAHLTFPVESNWLPAITLASKGADPYGLTA
jgi:hypothetical protein